MEHQEPMKFGESVGQAVGSNSILTKDTNWVDYYVNTR
jgi:hypothetical protein